MVFDKYKEKIDVNGFPYIGEFPPPIKQKLCLKNMHFGLHTINTKYIK